MKISERKLYDFPITEKKKSNKIMRKLTNMGYEINDAKDALFIFENHDIDKSQFDFPYGSFESYKQHVLAGNLELDLTSHVVVEDQHTENTKGEKSWETYSPEMKHWTH